MPIFHPGRTLNCKGRLVQLERPLIMGVLNITPDSFFDESRSAGEGDALLRAERMLKEGADFLDIGGMSSRPGAAPVTAEEEMRRVTPVIRSLAGAHPEAIISIDTVHAATARAAVEAGASMVNDISAGSMDPEMLSTVAELGLPYVAMHMKGRPENMQDDPRYEDVALEILDFFIKKVRECREAGIKDVIIDPGLGFGKTVMHNYEILARLEVLDMLECPILIGASRKSLITRLLNIPVSAALNGTTAVNMYALVKGAGILRVHDIKEARECVVIYQAIKAAASVQETH